MGGEERQGQPLQPETHAGAMGDGAVGAAQAEGASEFVLVAIEAGAGDGRIASRHVNLQFELQAFFLLARAEQGADPAEEGVLRRAQRRVQPENGREVQRRRRPMLAMQLRLFRGRDADKLMQPEGLQPKRVFGGLASKAVAFDVEEGRSLAEGAPGGEEGIDRIAGRWNQGDRARRKSDGPIIAGCGLADELAMLRFVALESGDRPTSCGKTSR